MKKTIHVAVGIILNDRDQVLIAKRPNNLHQGGLWEFPGGKVEKDEDVFEALVREFREEVDLVINDADEFMKIHHDYGDKKVILDIWKSKNFTGVARGIEGQKIRWVAPKELQQFQFPDANRAIVEKLSA